MKLALTRSRVKQTPNERRIEVLTLDTPLKTHVSLRLIRFRKIRRGLLKEIDSVWNKIEGHLLFTHENY